jgi:hypothetical protein
MQINNSLTELFYNEEFGVIDIKTTGNRNEFSVSDYVSMLIMHSTFKSFDGGETFAGSLVNFFSSGVEYTGNLKGVLLNASMSAEHEADVIDEVRTCLKTGVDAGVFSLPESNDVVLKRMGNLYYITINIIVNKKRQSLVFYYNGEINKIVLYKKP